MQKSAWRPGGASSGISNCLTKLFAENTPLDMNQLPLQTETSQAVPRGGCLAICFTYRATAVRVSASVLLLCVCRACTCQRSFCMLEACQALVPCL